MFIVLSLPQNLVKALAKNLVKNLAKHLIKNLARKLVKIDQTCKKVVMSKGRFKNGFKGIFSDFVRKQIGLEIVGFP